MDLTLQEIVATPTCNEYDPKGADIDVLLNLSPRNIPSLNIADIDFATFNSVIDCNSAERNGNIDKIHPSVAPGPECPVSGKNINVVDQKFIDFRRNLDSSTKRSSSKKISDEQNYYGLQSEEKLKSIETMVKRIGIDVSIDDVLRKCNEYAEFCKLEERLVNCRFV